MVDDGGVAERELSDDQLADDEPRVQRREILQAIGAGAVAIPAIGRFGESAAASPAMTEIDLMDASNWESGWDIVRDWDADRWSEGMTLQVDTSRTYEDDHSFQIGDGSAAAFVYDDLSASGRVEVEFNYWETGSINSGGAALLNENDEVVLLSGTDNAEWKFILDPESDFTSGNSDDSPTAYHYGGDMNYQRWRTHRLRVDEDGTFAVQTTDIQTGDTVEHCFENCLSGYPEETVRSYETIEKVLIWSENADEFWMENITLSVEQMQGFVVEIEATNAPVEAGETLDVTASITNTGETQETQDVILEINGEGVTTDAVTLDSGQSTERTLSWTAEDRNAVGVRVVSEDTADSDTVTLSPTADSAGESVVEIVDVNDPVQEGETMEVTAEITNVGDADLTDDIHLDVNNQREETKEVTLAPDASTTETFTWTATDRNGVSISVASVTDVDNRHVRLLPTPEETGEAAIEIVDANTPVSEGDTLAVDVEITNVGDAELTQDIHFDVDAQREETREVTLAPGASVIETFTWTVDDRASVGLRAAGEDDWDNSYLLLADTDFTPSGL